MTAPLTPHEQQPPEPSGPVPQGGARVGREVLVGLATTAAVAVAGLLLGLLWLWLAPRVPLVSDGSAVYLKDSEGEQAVGADGVFTLLGLGMGLLTAVVVFLVRRSGGIALAVGLVAGGVAASVVAWRFGVALGPTSNVVAHAKQAGVNKVFDAPLVLHAKAALLTWPLASALGLLGLTALFTSEPPATPWPGWGTPGQGYPAGYGPQGAGSGAHWVSYTPAPEPGAPQPTPESAAEPKPQEGADRPEHPQPPEPPQSPGATGATGDQGPGDQGGPRRD